MPSAGLSARGRKGGLAADHTSPLRRILRVEWREEAGYGWERNNVAHLILECGHDVRPATSYLLGEFSDRTPEPGQRRRCYKCAECRCGHGLSDHGRATPVADNNFDCLYCQCYGYEPSR